jgi:hypothetical protein
LGDRIRTARRRSSSAIWPARWLTSLPARKSAAGLPPATRRRLKCCARTRRGARTVTIPRGIEIEDTYLRAVMDRCAASRPSLSTWPSAMSLASRSGRRSGAGLFVTIYRNHRAIINNCPAKALGVDPRLA